jgi:hypothetical protein
MHYLPSHQTSSSEKLVDYSTRLRLGEGCRQGAPPFHHTAGSLVFRGRNAENDTGSCIPHEVEALQLPLQLPEKFRSSLDHASSVPGR